MTIPESVTNIKTCGFQLCTGLTSITIPSSVTSIGSYAFTNCTSLTSLTFRSLQTNIRSCAFSGCSELTDVYCLVETGPVANAEQGPLETDIFKDSYIEYATLHVPATAIVSYQSTSPWNEFGKIVTLEGNEPETLQCEKPVI